jgi:AcrR family transcriptional regulator
MLAGDAAHVHSPAGGQGMNLGITDAVALTGALSTVLHGSPDTLDAYSQFESLEELFFILYDAWATRIAEQVSTAIESGATITDLSGVVDRIVDTLLLERDWLVIKTDFLMYAARNPNLAHRWSVHRAQLRAVIEESLGASSIELHRSIGTVTEAARAVISVYDGIGIQLLLDDDLDAARDWLRQLLNVVLER